MSLAAFALRRALWTIPVLFVVVTLLFGMMRAAGGDPLRRGQLFALSNVSWNKSADPKPEGIERNMLRLFRLDQPWYVQYGDALVRTARFDFGNTFSFRARTVNSIVVGQGRISLELGLLALAWALALGLPLGIAAALAHGTALDAAARFAATAAYAVPSFLVGTVLVWLVSLRLGLLPASGWDGWQARVLPSLTLGLLPAGFLARLVRGSLLETLREEYVRTAVSKGLRRGRVVVVHVLRNSLVPAVTALGPLAGYLVTGSFVVELIFGIPGTGRYFVAAVLARDYPLVLGLTVAMTLVIVLANLLVDVAHAALDPRVREARH